VLQSVAESDTTERLNNQLWPLPWAPVKPPLGCAVGLSQDRTLNFSSSNLLPPRIGTTILTVVQTISLEVTHLWLGISEHGPWGAQASVAVVHRLSCSTACGIFPDQVSNPGTLHWQADSYPLYHQGKCLEQLCLLEVVGTGGIRDLCEGLLMG